MKIQATTNGILHGLVSTAMTRFALALCIVPTLAAKADLSISSLPNTTLITSYAEFGGGLLDESLVTINGNVGVSSDGTVDLMAPSRINGNVYVNSGATLTGPGTVHGTVFTHQSLGAVQSQIDSASSVLAGLAPNQTFSTLSTAQAFTVSAGNVHVVNVGTLNLNNANITLSGGGYLVINVSHGFDLTGTASILASNPSHVFINYDGTSGSFNTHVGDTVDGYVFDTTVMATLDGSWDGGLYGAQNEIELLSGATVTSAPPTVPVPEPSTIISGALLLVPLGISSLRALRQSRAAIK